MASRKKVAAKPPKKPAAGQKPSSKLQRYGDQALERLAWLMQHAESEQAQVAAAKELLERAGGSAGAPEPQGLDAVVDRLRQLRAKP